MLKMRAAAATVVARGSCSRSGARWCGAARRAFGQMAHSPRDSPNSIGFNRIKCKYHCQAHIYAQNKQQKWAARPGCSTGANKSSNDASNPLAKVPQQRPSGILLPHLIIDSIERGALAAPGQHWSTEAYPVASSMPLKWGIFQHCACSASKSWKIGGWCVAVNDESVVNQLVWHRRCR